MVMVIVIVMVMVMIIVMLMVTLQRALHQYNFAPASASKGDFLFQPAK